MNGIASSALAMVLVPSLVWAQEKAAPQAKNAKIRSAKSAAPATITDHATVMDWPTTQGARPVQLLAGNNTWICYPDDPTTRGNDPVCFDATWQRWGQAHMSKTAPNISSVGVAYMMAPGGAWGSNADPYATRETADNQWGYDPPHVMVVVPDTRALAGLPTERGRGAAPWVMWSGTPYAHIMVPVAMVPVAAPGP